MSDGVWDMIVVIGDVVSVVKPAQLTQTTGVVNLETL